MSGERPAEELFMNKEAKARIKINKPPTEHAIVYSNWELIRLYEEKVKKVIPARGRCERVWEG
ncbi:MAG: hypothetical protein JNM02_04215 [Anaerolineales bacterium]|nr:hypothetical protein [Anaerolineales bacterium]